MLLTSVLNYIELIMTKSTVYKTMYKKLHHLILLNPFNYRSKYYTFSVK